MPKLFLCFTLLFCLIVMPSVAQTSASSDEVEDRLQAAWHLLDDGRYQSALQAFDSVTREAPRNTEAYFGRAFALEQLGRDAEARIAYVTVLALDDKHQEARFYLGLQYHKAGLYDEAIQSLSVLVDQQVTMTNSILYEFSHDNTGIRGLHTLADNNALILYHRARSYRKAGKFNNALRDIDRALRQSPLKPDYMLEKALIREAEGNNEAAIILYKDLLAAKPGYTQALYNLSRLTSDGQADYQLAKEAYTGVIRNDSSLVEAWANRGIVHFDDGRYEKAASDFKQALDLDKSRAQSWINYGMALEKLDRFRDAARNFNEALALEPGNLSARLHLGNAYLKQRLHQEALDQYEEILSREPMHPGASFNKAIALYNLGQKVKACEVLQQAAENGLAVDENILNRVCR